MICLLNIKQPSHGSWVGMLTWQLMQLPRLCPFIDTLRSRSDRIIVNVLRYNYKLFSMGNETSILAFHFHYLFIHCVINMSTKSLSNLYMLSNQCSPDCLSEALSLCIVWTQSNDKHQYCFRTLFFFRYFPAIWYSQTPSNLFCCLFQLAAIESDCVCGCSVNI